MPETHSLSSVLSSSGRINILTLLSKVGELHLSEIAKRTGQSYSSADRHLQELAHASIVEEHGYGRVRLFRLNLDNPRVRTLRRFILEWDDDLAMITEVKAQA